MQVALEIPIEQKNPFFIQSTPYPPLTLSLGSWQITEEDLPIYVGSAAGVLLLIILLLGVTTWRCSTVPSSLSTTSNQSPTKSAREDTGKACLFRVTVYSNDLKYRGVSSVPFPFRFPFQLHCQLVSSLLALDATELVTQPLTQTVVEMINIHVISVQQKR